MTVGEPDPLDQDEYRVGKWDGKVEEGKAYITHDSIEDEILVDAEEISDLVFLAKILSMKDKLINGRPSDREMMLKNLEWLVKDLEA